MKVPFLALVAASLLLSACGGGGGGSSSSSLPPVGGVTATPTPIPTAGGTAQTLSSGTPEPTSGGIEYFPEGSAGMSANSPNGGTGNPVDGIPCTPGIDTQSGIYHKHVHVSLFSAGQQIYIPQAIGLVAPSGPTGTAPYTFISGGGCAYALHTHDRSGIIHIEAPQAPSAAYTLGNLFDIWGQPLSSFDVGGISGNVSIYVTGTTTDANQNLQPTNAPYLYMGDYKSLSLTEHQEITIEVNAPFAPIPNYVWNSYFAGS